MIGFRYKEIVLSFTCLRHIAKSLLRRFGQLQHLLDVLFLDGVVLLDLPIVPVGQSLAVQLASLASLVLPVKMHIL